MTGGVGGTYIHGMIKSGASSVSGLAAATEGQGEPSPIAADPYWEDISVQASARLARLEEEREQHAREEEIRQPHIKWRFAPPILRLVLMVAVGAILFVPVAWLLLKAVPTAALRP